MAKKIKRSKAYDYGMKGHGGTGSYSMKDSPIGGGFASMSILGTKKTSQRPKKGKKAKGGFMEGF